MWSSGPLPRVAPAVCPGRDSLLEARFGADHKMLRLCQHLTFLGLAGTQFPLQNEGVKPSQAAPSSWPDTQTHLLTWGEGDLTVTCCLADH